MRAGGAPVAATIGHWDLTDIADHFEKMIHSYGILRTLEFEAEYQAWQRQMDIKLGFATAATLAVDNASEEGTPWAHASSAARRL